MHKKSLFIAILAIMALSMVLTATSAHSASGVSNVNVTSCETVSNGVKISRNKGAKYTLTNGCRDAGYGLRNYSLSCNTATQYKVSWVDNCSNDKVAPKVTLSVSREGTITRVTATATDNVRVTKTTIYHVNGTAAASSNSASVGMSLTATAVGANSSYFAKAFDAAGNEGISVTIDLTRVDTVKPTVNVSSPKTDYLTNEVVHLKGEASDDTGVVKMQYLDEAGKILKTCLNINACNLDVGPFAKNWRGTRAYRLRAYDIYGNVGYGERKINITPYTDTVAPAIDIFYERQANGYVKISTHARDSGGSGVVRSEIYKDKTVMRACSGAGDCALTIAPGNYTVTNIFYAKVYDGVGNVGESKTVTITLYPSGDVTAPSVSLSGALIGGNYSLTATTIDSQSPLRGMEIFVNDSATSTFSWWDNDNMSLSATKSFVGSLTNGTMKFVAKAHDRNGNVGVSAPVYLTASGLTDSAPTISADARVTNQFGVDYVSLSAQATDDYGLAKTELYWGLAIKDVVLIKRCNYSGVTINENCSVSFPVLMAKNGYYSAVTYDIKNQTSTTMIKNY
ncbi:MAG: hypothetical protein WCT40_02820 [Candidatus Magasanikbacteria bacterium]|jgi:hypothetical protein